MVYMQTICHMYNDIYVGAVQSTVYTQQWMCTSMCICTTLTSFNRKRTCKVCINACTHRNKVMEVNANTPTHPLSYSTHTHTHTHTHVVHTRSTHTSAQLRCNHKIQDLIFAQQSLPVVSGKCNLCGHNMLSIIYLYFSISLPVQELYQQNLLVFDEVTTPTILIVVQLY